MAPMTWRGRLGTAVILCSVPALCAGQDLTPRAYLITPVSANAVGLTYALSKGEITFDPTLPVTDASGTVHTPVLTYYYAFGLLGRSANVTGALPWADGYFQASVGGVSREAHREGLLDSTFRVAVNLFGGPALTAAEFVKTPPSKYILGTSLRIVAPTGQYVSTRAINPGNNRWAFKPEVGFSRRGKRLIVDGYVGVWVFTTNDDYFAPSPDVKGSERKQSPIGSFEGHVSYDVNSPPLALVRRELLVRRAHDGRRRAQSDLASSQFAPRSHGSAAPESSSVGEGQLQQRRDHARRRQLQDPVGRVAVLVAGSSIQGDEMMRQKPGALNAKRSPGLGLAEANAKMNHVRILKRPGMPCKAAWRGHRIRSAAAFVTAGLILAAPLAAAAQDTREGTITAAQAEKAAALTPYVPSKAEAMLSRALDLLTLPPNGFYPYFGSVYSGGGFTLGAGYRHFVSDRSTVSVSGLYSLKNYKLFEVGLRFARGNPAPAEVRREGWLARCYAGRPTTAWVSKLRRTARYSG